MHISLIYGFCLLLTFELVGDDSDCPFVFVTFCHRACYKKVAFLRRKKIYTFHNMNAFFANVKNKAFRKCIIVPVRFLCKLSYFTFSTSNHVFIAVSYTHLTLPTILLV